MGIAVEGSSYDVFVSHGRPDHRHVADIVSALAELGLKAIDRGHLTPRAPWLRALDEAIGRCKAVVLLLGPHGFDNAQQYERDVAFRRLMREPGFPVVPVILPGTTADRPLNFLARPTWVDFSAAARVSDAPDELDLLAAAVRGTAPDAAVVRADICPYRGLGAFREEDSAFFVGRGSADEPDTPVGQLVRKVQEHSFVMVVGRTGSGKSSLVCAGLVPALRRQPDRFWHVISLRPGADPLRALAAAVNPRAESETEAGYAGRIANEAEALRSSAPDILSHMIREELARTEGRPDRLLLHVDQWEELYPQRNLQDVEARLRHSQDTNRFIALLLHAALAAPVNIVATVRADFYDSLIAHEELRALLPSQQLLLGAISRAELERAIVEPAREAGFRFEPADLVQQILDDAGTEAGVLPLLQYVLAKTWAHRDGNLMTAESYERSGGVREAVRLMADGALEMSSDRRVAVPELILASLRREQERQDAELKKQEAGLERERTRIAELKAEQGETARRQQRTAQSQYKVRRVLAAAAVIVLLVGSIVGAFLANSALRMANRSRQLQVQEDELYKGPGLQLKHAQANILGELSRIRLAQDEVDSALRFALRGTKIDMDLPADVVRVPRASAALAAAAFQAYWILNFGGHENNVAAVAFSPDGKRIVTASYDGSARLWDVETSRELAVLRGHQGYVNSAVFSPDGKRVVTVSDDHTGRLWDAETGRSVAELRGHEEIVMTAAFSPDGKRIVTASYDGAARLWDAETGRNVAELRGHEGNLNSAAFSPDGKRIVTASDDRTARLWDAETGRELLELRGHEDIVVSAAFSPDGSRIVTASRDRTARLWDAESGNDLAQLHGHGGFVNSAAFSQDGKFVVTASDDATALLWDVETGQELAELRGHEGIVNTAAFSPDGKRIVTASYDSTARLWDAATGQELAVLRGHLDIANSAVFSPNGKYVATVSRDATARLWDADAGRPVAELRGHDDAVNSAAFSPDGTRIVTESGDMTARVWDAATGREIVALRGHGDTVNTAAFSPDGKRVVTASDDSTANVWDAETGREIAALRGHDGPVNFAASSPDGTSVVTAGNDKTARIWVVETAREMTTLRGHEDTVNSAAFSPDGMRVVTASSDKTARIWAVATARELATLRGHEQTVNSAVFNPDGTRVVTASDDGTARVFDVETGREVAALRGHMGGVRSAVFSPDGKRIATASRDATARVWDAETGREAAVLRGARDEVKSAMFSPDSKRLVTASNDGTVRLWDVETGNELVALRGPNEDDNSAAFSPDGKRVVIASGDKTARVWDVGVLTMPAAELVKQICARFVGLSKLTRDEMRLAGDPDSTAEIDVCKP